MNKRTEKAHRECFQSPWCVQSFSIVVFHNDTAGSKMHP